MRTTYIKCGYPKGTRTHLRRPWITWKVLCGKGITTRLFDRPMTAQLCKACGNSRDRSEKVPASPSLKKLRTTQGEL